MPTSTQRAPKQPTDIDAGFRLGSAPNKIDRRRWLAFKAGQSAKDIADQEGVQEKTVQFSLDRVRADNQNYSSDEVTIQVRKLLLKHLPEHARVLSEAMAATKQVTRQVVAHDVLTGNTVQLQESIREPDHDIRLRAAGEHRSLISVIQPREPLVSIDQRSQTNIMNATATPVTPNQMTSPEAVIRAIRAQRGLALADGAAAAVIEAVVENAVEDVDGDGDELDEEDEDDDGA